MTSYDPSSFVGSPTHLWADPAIAGKFTVERVIGNGGMGIVVAARHLELDELVAIKFLLPEAARSPAAQARFRREARAAAKIKNEHVARVIDVSATSSGIPYIVMEYLEGRDLERVLGEAPENRLSPQDAVDIILQAAEALAEGHRVGIVHRDMKPANLFCVEHGLSFPLVKVLDFGISKFSAARSDLERTDRNEILGSPRYMSPEQIDSSCTVDLRADIWSVGVILYEMLTGHLPFGGQAVTELWYHVRTESPPLPSALCSEVPNGLDAVVLKCLEKEPSRRYAHLGELALALTPYASPRARTSLECLIGQSQTVTLMGERPSGERFSREPGSVGGSSASITARRPHWNGRTLRWGGALVAGLGVIWGATLLWGTLFAPPDPARELASGAVAPTAPSSAKTPVPHSTVAVPPPLTEAPSSQPSAASRPESVPTTPSHQPSTPNTASSKRPSLPSRPDSLRNSNLPTAPGPSSSGASSEAPAGLVKDLPTVRQRDGGTEIPTTLPKGAAEPLANAADAGTAP